MTDQVSYKQVQAALRPIALEQDREFLPGWQFYSKVADAAGMTTDPHNVSRQARSDWDRFTGQVDRALKAMVAAGELASERTGRRLVYRTPAYHESILEARRAERMARSELMERRAAIRARLTRMQLNVPLSGPLHLPEAEWEKLLDLAEHGRAARERW